MVTRRRHRARSLTVVTAILACGLATAAYSAPADTAQAGVASGTVSVDGRQYEPEPTPEREYEPEPTAAPAPERADESEPPATPDRVDEPEPTATPDRQYEPEPAPSPAPGAEAPAPDGPAPDGPAPDAAAPDAAPDPSPPGQDAPADRPLAVAGSPRPHTEPESATDGSAPAPRPPAGPGPAEPSGVSARASQPPGSMTPLRSSTMDSFDDEVLAPLVAPARADTSARRVTTVTPADRELLASAGQTVTEPAASAGSTDAPSPAMIVASALLALVAATSAGAYALDRRRAR